MKLKVADGKLVKHGGKRLSPGDTFTATGREADSLLRKGLATEVKERKAQAESKTVSAPSSARTTARAEDKAVKAPEK